MALVGNLRDLKLPSLIQLNCMERNTAKLTVENEGKYGFIYFENGQVVHAEYEPDMGEEAVFKLLTLYSGKFKVESGIRAPVKSIKTYWNNLLLKGLNQMDNEGDDDKRKFDKVFEKLLAVRGVESIAIIDAQGNKIADSSDVLNDKNFLFALTAFEIGKISNLLNVEKPSFVGIAGSRDKYIFTTFEEKYMILKLNIKIKLEVVIPFIKQAMA
jgi:predicted regulator of Ras-like GTPase activity (Roadblock/LC7/MglB family)